MELEEQQPIINVVLVDDQKLIRQGIIRMFEDHPHIQVIHEAADGLEIIDWFRKKGQFEQVDVVLMDMQMPNLNGWDTTRILVENYPDVKIIGLSSYDNEAFVDQLISNGGRGYLLKVQDINEIIDAIEQVHESGYYINDRMPFSKISNFFNVQVTAADYKSKDLTHQQIKIIQLICQEKTSQEIANQLCLSIKTVNTHRERILMKIGAKNMVGIAIYAIRHKMVELI